MKAIRITCIIGVAAVLCCCLFNRLLGPSVGLKWWEIQGFFERGQTQWIAVACLGAYVTLFAFINSYHSDKKATIRGFELWKMLFLGCCLAGYLRNYKEASSSNELTVLLGGAAISSAVMAVSAFKQTERKAEAIKWSFIGILTLLLFAGVFLDCNDGVFLYKGHIRWLGPWGNPNIYGMLMGAGALMAFGLSYRFASLECRGKFKFLRGAGTVTAAAIGLCMLIGLWESYSRGAWLGALAGAGYAVIRCRQAVLGWLAYVRRAKFLPYAVAVLCASVLVAAWFQMPRSATFRRMASVCNANDFSWRNRVSAWEGALEMIGDRPWLGFGWHQPAVWYQNYYSSGDLVETAAICLNDYLVLGASVGIPSLLAFGAVLCIGFGLWESYSPPATVEPTSWRPFAPLQTTCRSALLCLVTAFWFEGGLLVLPTAVTFWILLELARTPCGGIT